MAAGRGSPRLRIANQSLGGLPLRFEPRNRADIAEEGEWSRLLSASTFESPRQRGLILPDKSGRRASGAVINLFRVRP